MLTSAITAQQEKHSSHNKFAKLQIMVSDKLGVLGVPTIHKTGLSNVVSWSLETFAAHVGVLRSKSTPKSD